MFKRFITADWHLGENRFQIMQRHGFTDAQDMVDHLVKVHNEIVSSNDEVLIVGDIVNQKTPQYLEQVSRFNGYKVLFRGNHDRVFTDEQLEPYFERIVPEGEGEYFKVGELNCFVTHYPTQAKKDTFNLVGHIHSAWKFQLNMVNVGVDANHYKPHNLDEDIPFYFDAISKFYDRDVWCAYLDVNKEYCESRGSKGRYLDS